MEAIGKTSNKKMITREQLKEVLNPCLKTPHLKKQQLPGNPLRQSPRG